MLLSVVARRLGITPPHLRLACVGPSFVATGLCVASAFVWWLDSRPRPASRHRQMGNSLSGFWRCAAEIEASCTRPVHVSSGQDAHHNVSRPVIPATSWEEEEKKGIEDWEERKWTSQWQTVSALSSSSCVITSFHPAPPTRLFRKDSVCGSLMANGFNVHLELRLRGLDYIVNHLKRSDERNLRKFVQVWVPLSHLLKNNNDTDF